MSIYFWRAMALTFGEAIRLSHLPSEPADLLRSCPQFDRLLRDVLSSKLDETGVRQATAERLRAVSCKNVYTKESRR
jgi:hypothetical protein